LFHKETNRTIGAFLIPDGALHNAIDLCAAALAAAMSTAVPAHAAGEWPDGPNRLWFENLQRPDNRRHGSMLRQAKGRTLEHGL
jgi:hypothetical protein